MNMQLSFVEDDPFRKVFLNKISANLYTASWSISSNYQNIKKSFTHIEDKYIKERLIDTKQMIISLLELMHSRKELNLIQMRISKIKL